MSMKKSGEVKIRLLLVSLGVMMIAGGILRGEVQVVLRKAVNICLECIGIG